MLSTAPSEAPLAPASDSRSDAERDTTALPMVDRVQSSQLDTLLSRYRDELG